MNDRIARAALSRLSEPGEPRLTGLVARLGAERVHTLLLEEQDVSGVYTDVAERLRGLDPERELARAAEQGIRFVCPGDDEWPEELQVLEGAGTVNGRGGAPLGLWVRGPMPLAEATRRAVAVVGSRSATTYGAEVAGRMGADLAAAGVTVVSGAAYGIDVAAHRGALAAKGPTVAVLACGVDRAYPAGNKAVLDYIASHGLVVSELPPGCAPTKLRFLSRNRLIAALARGTVVVEAAVRSGALSTANWASRTGRVLMGVPGPVTSAPSEGVHELIRTGEALLVTRPAHVLELVSGAGEHLVDVPRAPLRARDRLSLVQQQVLDAVPVAAAAPASSVARTAGVSSQVAEQSLLRLRQAGLVEEGATGWRLSSGSTPPAP
jgi:DNA processing protein